MLGLYRASYYYQVEEKDREADIELMGLEAIYPKKNLSQPRQPEVKFPHLMNGLKIDRPNQSCCADITYIPLKEGFGYCVSNFEDDLLNIFEAYKGKRYSTKKGMNRLLNEKSER